MEKKEGKVGLYLHTRELEWTLTVRLVLICLHIFREHKTQKHITKHLVQGRTA